MDGILLVDKKEGDSSFDTVRRVRKISGYRKVGHAGTLDPFATGLLIILINQGTKLFNFLMSKEKLYRATIYLGVETDTFDCTGKITGVKDLPDLDEEYINRRLKDFVGLIEQTPPVFSAIKHGGVRSYKLARRGVDVKLKKRSVYVHDIKLIFWDPPELVIDVKCSAGTYIRSLAVDIARSLETCGHLKELRRISCGSFHVNDAIPVTSEVTKESLEKRLIPLADALPDLETISVDDRMASRLRNGFQPRIKEKGLAGAYIKFVKEDSQELVAIAQVNENGGIRLERVFN